jgi:hypothetical protein
MSLSPAADTRSPSSSLASSLPSFHQLVSSCALFCASTSLRVACACVRVGRVCARARARACACACEWCARGRHAHTRHPQLLDGCQQTCGSPPPPPQRRTAPAAPWPSSACSPAPLVLCLTQQHARRAATPQHTPRHAAITPAAPGASARRARPVAAARPWASRARTPTLVPRCAGRQAHRPHTRALTAPALRSPAR